MEAIEKYFKTPGRCTVKECEDAKEFLTKYLSIRDTYRRCTGYDPTGLTLESDIDKVDWYIDFHTNNPNFATS